MNIFKVEIHSTSKTMNKRNVETRRIRANNRNLAILKQQSIFETTNLIIYVSKMGSWNKYAMFFFSAWKENRKLSTCLADEFLLLISEAVDQMAKLQGLRYWECKFMQMGRATWLLFCPCMFYFWKNLNENFINQMPRYSACVCKCIWKELTAV